MNEKMIKRVMLKSENKMESEIGSDIKERDQYSLRGFNSLGKRRDSLRGGGERDCEIHMGGMELDLVRWRGSYQVSYRKK